MPALFEPDVARFDLWHPPRRIAAGRCSSMSASSSTCRRPSPWPSPRKVVIYVKDDDEAKAWEWPMELQKALGTETVKIRKVP